MPGRCVQRKNLSARVSLVVLVAIILSSARTPTPLETTLKQALERSMHPSTSHALAPLELSHVYCVSTLSFSASS
jgi:hypothetical protein